MKKLAIVILNWNGADMMRQYLPTVLKNSVGDVIVADNASTDGSVQMLQQEFPEVPVIVLEENFGFAEGYNRALVQLPDYEYYLLLNSDVEIRQKEWDAPLLKYMDAHPNCAACQPKLLSLRQPSTVNCQLSTVNCQLSTVTYHDRIIDIDILLYDDLHINTPKLTIPHPLMYERDFVLIPLKEILLTNDTDQ